MVEKVCHGNFQLSGCGAGTALREAKGSKLLLCSCNQKQLLIGCTVSSFTTAVAGVYDSVLKNSLMCQIRTFFHWWEWFCCLWYCSTVALMHDHFITVKCYRVLVVITVYLLLFNVWFVIEFVTFKGCWCRCCESKTLTGLMRYFLAAMVTACNSLETLIARWIAS